MELNKKAEENLKLKEEIELLRNIIKNLRSRLLGHLIDSDKKYLVDFIDENLKI